MFRSLLTVTNNPKDWQTRRELAVYLLRVADDIEWDTYGKRDVQHLRSRAKDLLDTDPNEKEPPF